MNKSFNISNSLLSGYTDYKNEEMCGLYFKAIYIDKSHKFPSSAAMRLGQYFEYICTGEVLRDGTIPQALYTKAKEPTMTADYVRAQLQKKNFNRLYKYKKYNSGKILEFVIDGQNYKGVLDVDELDQDGKTKAIRDLKYTGVIDNKWENFGWVDIRQKKHPNQAKMYIWLWWKLTGNIVPFYFDVFSSKNAWQFKIFKIIMDKTSLIEFETWLIQTVDLLKFDLKVGMIAYPDLEPCRDCPLRNGCSFFTDLPKVEELKY